MTTTQQMASVGRTIARVDSCQIMDATPETARIVEATTMIVGMLTCPMSSQWKLDHPSVIAATSVTIAPLPRAALSGDVVRFPGHARAAPVTSPTGVIQTANTKARIVPASRMEGTLEFTARHRLTIVGHKKSCTTDQAAAISSRLAVDVFDVLVWFHAKQAVTITVALCTTSCHADAKNSCPLTRLSEAKRIPLTMASTMTNASLVSDQSVGPAGSTDWGGVCGEFSSSSLFFVTVW